MWMELWMEECWQSQVFHNHIECDCVRNLISRYTRIIMMLIECNVLVIILLIKQSSDIRPYLLNMSLLGPDRPCHFLLCKKSGCVNALCVCVFSPLSSPFWYCQYTLLGCMSVSVITDACLNWKCLSHAQNFRRSPPSWVWSTTFTYFFPDRLTLFNFCQCPSNNVSNRYGLIYS